MPLTCPKRPLDRTPLRQWLGFRCALSCGAALALPCGAALALSCGAALALLLVSGGALAEDAPSERAAVDQPQHAALVYEDHVAPLLERHCYDCHNSDDREGQLDLTTAAGLLKGSESGSVLTPHSLKHSLLYEMIRDGEMPPDGETLAAAEIDLIGKWIASGASFRDPPESAVGPPSQHDVLPILLLRCTACHGAQLQRGDLDLRTIEGLLRGGEHGAVAVAGDPDGSAMLVRIEQQLCPPKGELLKYFVERPGATEIETLRRWIAAGLPQLDDAALDDVQEPALSDADREHWAFQPLPKRIAVPTIEGVELGQPIDAFIYRELAVNKLTFSPAAERSTLIRRVFFDLTGLPPSVQELQRWQDHQDERWYEEMVDQLLASARYGERWGRRWLDLAGYADSEGGQSEDPVRENAWKYRDYVIRSFNQDKPWDQFITEQLAGDELSDYSDPQQVTEQTVEQLTATGFLRMGVDETGSRTMNFVPERLGVIADALNVVSSSLMGLTMECARCHSHKYDPISQSDYYRFKAIFQGAFDEHDWMSWKTRQLEVASPQMIAERQRINGPLETSIKQLEAARKSLVKSWQDRYYEQSWPQLSSERQQEILAALKALAGRRTLRQIELVEMHDRDIRPSETVLAQRHDEFALELQELDTRLAEAREQLIPPLAIRALWDRGSPSPTYVLIRGEHDRPGRPVEPALPAAIPGGSVPYDPSPPPGASSTGRRLAFAKWLTAADHPLTARVLVNRVWQQYFGVGIVKTLDNFGRQGAEPTHPELLDWLARELVDSGWSLKSLHRTILLSRTYQQSSSRRPEAARVDPENRLLWRMTMRRLDAEALRDSLLALSDRLDEKMFGPPAEVTVREDGLIMQRASRAGSLRRSIYLQHRRTEMPSLLSVFDYPEMQPNCGERSVSTVATQSLILMNNAWIHEFAAGFARRILADCGDDRADGRDDGSGEAIRQVYLAALGRMPSAEEQSDAMQTLDQLRQLWLQSDADPNRVAELSLTTFCHTVMNSAEFLYVD